ncbi:hypothetical protein GDO78_013647 [Eleutherodactylus coqui]|uniref:Uncharacterized protein n=1 Tax=Eleutherodactylus coqui TaxID=57060 RepID=A0A8J6JR09_ELECQ|nr:hypothetical protein GDO78_013647 [Eleutherodactylus coqui]
MHAEIRTHSTHEKSNTGEKRKTVNENFKSDTLTCSGSTTQPTHKSMQHIHTTTAHARKKTVAQRMYGNRNIKHDQMVAHHHTVA